MKLPVFVICLLFTGMQSIAATIEVKNSQELENANLTARPGDIIILRNGIWQNTTISLSCQGTKEKPITFKAQTSGKVHLTGNSKLQLGGTFIIVEGLHFLNGYAAEDAVITFRIDNDRLANNCRVTNTVINDYNNPKRLSENYWVALYGKNNRIDHCSFLNKTNIAVLLAVILDDERSRENFHSIDHNYFGERKPLASNAGEIIRVGVSQHCEFNSYTQITDNYFEHCDGETEIISVKSCRNTIRKNIFKECQGGVVLRHGNYNTVESNIFLGNNKEGTGGVRIINKGQWVVNNLFYKCRGTGFRSPLSIMNGIPNSPANRYLEVSDAVISNNSFFECTPISFCEGSDAERSVQPYRVTFLNNLFYNSKDQKLYNVFDDISRINFSGNLVSNSIEQQLTNGFSKTVLAIRAAGQLKLPDAGSNLTNPVPDSLRAAGSERQVNALAAKQGLSDIDLILDVLQSFSKECGAKWYIRTTPVKKQITLNCKSAGELNNALAEYNNYKLIINLTGRDYTFTSPLNIQQDVLLKSTQKQSIRLTMTGTSDYFIQLKAGNSLKFNNLNLDLSSLNSGTFITTDTSGSSNHCNFSMNNCTFTNSNCTIFNAARSSVSDSIIISNCRFKNGRNDVFRFIEETDNKGYYNVEKLAISNCLFTDQKGSILQMLRSGKDESTMGPLLIFANNKLSDCSTNKDAPLFTIRGVQRSFVENNYFTNCNTGKDLLQYEDWVRAVHFFRKNVLSNTGKVLANQYVLTVD